MTNTAANLLNRNHFFSMLSDLIQKSLLSDITKTELAPSISIAVLVLGAHHFRKINNLYGYAVGDELLQIILSRLTSVLPQELTISRISNSTYGIIIPSIKHHDQALLAANKIIKILQEPFNINTNLLKVKFSVGITLKNIAECSSKETTPDSLLLEAENAFIVAKKNNIPYLVYTENTTFNHHKNIEIENQLNSAIEENEFYIYYQPKICFKTNMPIGAEALLRWKNPNLGEITPAVFIPISEQTGQIIPLSFWTLNTVLRHMSEWPAHFTTLNVAINFSPITIQHEDFVDKILSALQIWGVNPERLTIEITESTLLTDPVRTFEILKQLKDLGIKISIDDFGTGYSSLSHFKNIPATELKIDQSFVLNMHENAADAHITQMIVHIGHGFGMTVVAEGIENLTTYETLSKMGCDIAQGFFIARPMAHNDLKNWFFNFNPDHLKSKNNS